MKIKTITKPTEQDRIALRLLVRAREDFQAQRKRMDNRLGVKADGTDQNITERQIRVDDMAQLSGISTSAREQEQLIEKILKQMLKRFPVWTNYLEAVKGVGTISAAIIISEIDIHKATTVSKIWQYAGLNPSTVCGHKRVATEHPAKYKPESGEVVRRGEDFVIVRTNHQIKADRLTEGFISPFNKRLRVALCGVLADSFIKSQAPYALEHYYPYKKRLEQSENITNEISKGGKVAQVKWKDAKPIHRDRAAKRKMIKMFLADLYAAWREIEGLEVRAPYQEQYLGHKHAA